MNVINTKLVHSEFGEGLLKSFNGNTIVVRFSHGDETLEVPKAFLDGELKTTNREDEEKINEMLERWKTLNVETNLRNAEIEQDPRVAATREYDEKMRKENETDKQLQEKILEERARYKEIKKS